MGHAEEIRRARIETLGDVAAVLSHEAHNLLGALRTCVQILRRNPHITEQDMELLDIIQSGSTRLNEILSQFSAFRHPQAFPFEEVPLHELIEETLTLLRRDERFAPSIAIRRQFDPTVHTIKVVRDRLRQALWNLFLNAVEAMGDCGQLEVETQKRGSEVKILVRDTGAGILADALPHIFQPLYTTKPRATGLGLALTRCIVEEHGGRISVRSKPGVETCITVLLPIEAKRKILDRGGAEDAEGRA